MPTWTIPDNDEAAFPVQSQVFNADLEVLRLGMLGYRAESGLAVTPQGSPDMTVHVSAGVVRVGGPETIPVDADDLTIGAAHASLMRLDLVSVSGSGVLTITAGTPALTDVVKPPDIPSGHVPLAFVTVPPSAPEIGADQIVGKGFAMLHSGLLTRLDLGNSGASKDIDVQAADIQKVTLNNATPTITTSNWPDTGTPWLVRIHLKQDGTGGRVPDLPAAFEWGVPGEPDWAAMAADESTFVDCYSDNGGTIIYASIPDRMGPAGLGVPAGGTTGQVLAKVSGADNDTEWADTSATAPTIIRGHVNADGTIANGDGFTVDHPSTGLYELTFDSAFPDDPVVVATAYEDKRNASVAGSSLSTTGATILTDSGGTLENRPFFFIAIAV